MSSQAAPDAQDAEDHDDRAQRQAFGERVRSLREAHPQGRGASGQPGTWTQEWVAKQLSVSANAYTDWERGGRWPKPKHLVALANFFNVSVDYLLGVRPLDVRSITFTERGVAWTLDQRAPATPANRYERKRQEDRRLAEEIWHRLLKGGETCMAIAQDRRITKKRLNQLVTDLVVTESVHIKSVERDRRLADTLLEQFNSYFASRTGASVPDLKVEVARIGHVDSPVIRAVLLGHVAMEYFCEAVVESDNVTIGLCGGFAISRFVYALQPGDCPAGIKVYPIAVTPDLERASVSANSLAGTFMLRHFAHGAEAEQQVAIGSPDARLAAWAAEVDYIFMGVGSRESQAMLRQGRNPDAVGDILYVPVDRYGTPLTEPHPGAPEWSIGLDKLRRVVASGRRVVIIASGEDRAGVLCAAVRGGYANVLIIDDFLATAASEAWNDLEGTEPGER